MDSTHSVSKDGPKGVRRAILAAVEKVKGFSYLPQAHIDVMGMKTFLISRGYSPENIVLMMHHSSIDKNLYPSRANILREIDRMVRHTSQHDHIFFYYTGHGDQVICGHHSETDGKDEAILTYTGKRITDNVLKEHLVDPLPRGAKLFALWDCCHSHTILDLEHYRCNAKRTLSRLARKTTSLSKRVGTSLFREISRCWCSTKPEDDSQTRTESLGIDSLNLLRVTSPDTYLKICTPDCPMTLPEMRVMADVVSLSACEDHELAYDDSATGGTLTKFFIEYLESNPRASYQDLLSYIKERVDIVTQKRAGEKKLTGKKGHYPHRRRGLSGNDLEIEDWHKCEYHNRRADDTSTATLNPQQPCYSSHYRLDLSQAVDI